jgi:hypothetical protein
MRQSDDFDVLRRDDRLIRVRRLSLWIAGSATAVSLGLATVLSAAIPGRAVTTTTQTPAGQSGASHGQPGNTGGSGHGTNSGHRTNTGHRADSRHRAGSRHRAAKARDGLTPPAQPPSASQAPPVVSSGGS